MIEEPVETVEPAETAEPPEEAQAKTLRLEMRITEEQSLHLEKLANYAALESIIPHNHRGNKTAWVNYCLQLGEEALKQYAYKKRGFGR